MIGKLNHVAIVVPDLCAASEIYRDILGASISAPMELWEHGVATIIIHLPNAKIELLQPLGDNSPITNFLQKNPAGGLHHICYEVPDIKAAAAKLVAKGARTIGKIKTGAHGKPVLFLHPKDFCGTLIELEEA